MLVGVMVWSIGLGLFVVGVVYFNVIFRLCFVVFVGVFVIVIDFMEYVYIEELIV